MSNSPSAAREEAWITGLGLVSSLGEGPDAHWRQLARTGAPAAPIIDATAFAPYVIHPLAEIDFSRQIAKRSDQRQMEGWQRIGTYAAGLALDDAGIKGQPALLDSTIILAAAGNGERDPAADSAVLTAVEGAGLGDMIRGGAALNETLARELRPTLYLAQQSQLLAGNISIVHNVTGSSRSYKGEEIAGAQVVEDAVRRIWAGQGAVFLVGASCSAERWDQLLIAELGGRLWRDDFRPVWSRLAGTPAGAAGNGGMIFGSMGVFLVIEARSHAERRGARPYARVAGVNVTRRSQDAGALATRAQALCEAAKARSAELPVLSAASGFEPASLRQAAGAAGADAFEHAVYGQLAAQGVVPHVRAYASLLGHGIEAQFPMGVALAALALSRGGYYPAFEDHELEATFSGAPREILVMGLGNVVGEGLALITCADG